MTTDRTPAQDLIDALTLAATAARQVWEAVGPVISRALTDMTAQTPPPDGWTPFGGRSTATTIPVWSEKPFTLSAAPDEGEVLLYGSRPTPYTFTPHQARVFGYRLHQAAARAEAGPR